MRVTFVESSISDTIISLAKKSQGGRVAGVAAPQHTNADLVRAFFEHIPAGVYFKDLDSRFVGISRSLVDRFGLGSPGDALGKTDFDIFSEEHAKQAFDDEQEIIRSGRPIVNKEEKETWPDGRETWVLTTKLPWTDASGLILGTMGISQDITERKRAEQELRLYKERLESLVAQRTAELVRVNVQLEGDIAARKLAEGALAEKAEELARSNQILENISLTDDLTGLYNRKGFLALAAHRVKLANRNQEPFSIAFIDLDHLKEINDTFGHLEGDRALRDTSNLLRECFRESDIIARLGGDEFAIFIAEADQGQIASRIQERLSAHQLNSELGYRLSFSMGVVGCSNSQADDVEGLLRQADVLMYQQKRKTRSARRREQPKAKTVDSHRAG
ncbi:MAG TPA: diguanylate cyclase [Terriglobales bacterium]|nr:diguanylate cyclase [Terriglobales bacterium]